MYSRVPARALLCVVLAAIGGAGAAEVTVGEEIFANREAADVVREARRYDPQFSRQVDRERAASLYEKAISLQPGAKINAALARRIAQLSTHYQGLDKQKARAMAPKAITWWKQCIAWSNPKQLQWAEAHMGLGCTLVATGELRKAADAFRGALGLDVDNIEWPAWIVMPNLALESGRRYHEEQMARIRRNGGEIKIKAVDLVHYVLAPRDGAAAISALHDIAAKYKGTPAGTHARELAEKTRASARPDARQPPIK